MAPIRYSSDIEKLIKNILRADRGKLCRHYWTIGAPQTTPYLDQNGGFHNLLCLVEIDRPRE